MLKVVLPNPSAHPGVPRDPATPVRVPEAEFTAYIIDNPQGPVVFHLQNAPPPNKSLRQEGHKSYDHLIQGTRTALSGGSRGTSVSLGRAWARSG